MKPPKIKWTSPPGRDSLTLFSYFRNCTGVRGFRTRTRCLPVGLKIEIHEIHQNLRNPLSINRNPPSATKSTSNEWKLIEIQRKPPRNQRLPRNPVCAYEIYEIHAFARNQWGTFDYRMLKFKIEATSMALSQPTVPWWCSVALDARRRRRLGGCQLMHRKWSEESKRAWTTFALTTANCQECDTMHAGGIQTYRP